MNISAKTKIFSKIFKGVNLGSRYYGFMKKTTLRKSHATVPLNTSAHFLALEFEFFHLPNLLTSVHFVGDFSSIVI